MSSITRSHVCGVTCHPGGHNCNGYCKDQRIDAPETYEIALFDFGEAIKALKAGKMVAREGWNGKGMWISMSGGTEPAEVMAANFWSHNNAKYASENGGSAKVLPCITMKTATGEILMGWLASQSDMLADDWMILG